MKYRLGICGLYFHIGAVTGLPEDKVKLAGIADGKYPEDSIFFNPNVDPEKFAAERNVPLYGNYMELLDREDPDIVAVYCVDSQKSEVIIEALRRGKHVVADKPLCTGPEQLAEIEKAAAASTGSLALLLPFPCSGIYRKIKEIIDSGDTGEILSVRSRRAYIQKVNARPKWFFTKQYGGGLLCDIGTHEYDLVRYLTGKDAVEVTAYAANGKIKQFESGEDYAHALFKMTDKVFYSLHLDRISALNSVGDQSSMEIIGTKGQIIVPIGSNTIIVTVEGSDGPAEITDFPAVAIYDELMKDYLAAMETGDFSKRFFAPQVLKSVKGVLAAQKSADNDGKKIIIQENIDDIARTSSGNAE
ncbi:MAG: Gfo/Idh/MocA family oxidoreductase [Victivallaceae bacterium]|nr:Gfo/Idh/MocA family oxidoreductase [Victivallaceae bacterium]